MPKSRLSSFFRALDLPKKILEEGLSIVDKLGYPAPDERAPDKEGPVYGSNDPLVNHVVAFVRRREEMADRERARGNVALAEAYDTFSTEAVLYNLPEVKELWGSNQAARVRDVLFALGRKRERRTGPNGPWFVYVRGVTTAVAPPDVAPPPPPTNPAATASEKDECTCGLDLYKAPEVHAENCPVKQAVAVAPSHPTAERPSRWSEYLILKFIGSHPSRMSMDGIELKEVLDHLAPVSANETTASELAEKLFKSLGMKKKRRNFPDGSHKIVFVDEHAWMGNDELQRWAANRASYPGGGAVELGDVVHRNHFRYVVLAVNRKTAREDWGLAPADHVLARSEYRDDGPITIKVSDLSFIARGSPDAAPKSAPTPEEVLSRTPADILHEARTKSDSSVASFQASEPKFAQDPFTEIRAVAGSVADALKSNAFGTEPRYNDLVTLLQRASAVLTTVVASSKTEAVVADERVVLIMPQGGSADPVNFELHGLRLDQGHLGQCFLMIEDPNGKRQTIYFPEQKYSSFGFRLLPEPIVMTSQHRVVDFPKNARLFGSLVPA